MRAEVAEIAKGKDRGTSCVFRAATVLDANWAADADGVSDVAWQHLHQGGRYDAMTGLYHFNNGGKGRDYSATLGRGGPASGGAVRGWNECL